MNFLFIHLVRQPLYQLAFFLLLTLLLIPFIGMKSSNAAWNVAGVLYIGFIFINALCSWFEESMWTYFFISIGYSLLYILLAGILVSLLVSALKISGSGESAMIFMFIIYHPVILLFVILLKWIIGSI